MTYDGQTTNVTALVTSGLSNEIVLSWRALQRLRVLPENYLRSQYSRANKSEVKIPGFATQGINNNEVKEDLRTKTTLSKNSRISRTSFI